MSQSFNYRHLYYFWVVAKEGGMARAAERLDMAVQTISAQVRALEQALGVSLLRNEGRNLVLTEAGVAAAALTSGNSEDENAEVIRALNARELRLLYMAPERLASGATVPMLRRAGVLQNQGFGGVYGFDAPTPGEYGALMQAWLEEARDGSLLMCHPATAEVPGDAIGRQRPVEFAYLMSDAFAQALQRQGCQGFRQDADTGIYRRRLHGRKLIDVLAAGRWPKEITEIRADIIVLRLVPGTEQAG